jgi:TrpR-related protein YerC/YecD
MQDHETAGHHRLYEAMALLQTPQECRAFLRDICTIKELQAMAQRLEVALRLDQGQNYNAVCEQTGASTATISRVNKCLVYGDGGYRLVLDRMREELP